MNGIGWGGYGHKEIENFNYNFVDISYAKIILDYGLIFTILILGGYTAILVKNCKEKNYWMFCAICFVLIWALVEPYIIDIGRNVFVISLMPLLEIGKINNLDYRNIFKKKREKHETK